MDSVLFTNQKTDDAVWDSDIVRWRHRDGHWIYLEGMVVNQLHDPHIQGMINTFHDVTARIEMEQALTAAKEAAEASQERQQRFLARQLEEIYALRFARSGVEALPEILRHPPDLILSDVMMPGLDGIALCQKLREHFSARDLPILLLSAKGRAEDRLSGFQAGANDYLSKPFSMDELRLRIHNHLCVRRTAPTQPPAWPEQVRSVLSDLMGKGPFGAGELADALGMSQRQLQRRCIESFGQTPGQLIQDTRLRRARQLLESGEVDSVADAARIVGVSPSHLSRRFRAVFNQTPKQFLAEGALAEITEP